MKSEPVLLYEDKLSIQIPTDFTETEERKPYFQASNPEHLYVDPKHAALIAVTRTSAPLAEEKLKEKLGQYCVVYKSLTPDFFNCKMACRTMKSGNKIGAFHYTSTLEDEQMLNLLALTILDGQELLIYMRCAIKYGVDTALALSQTLSSVEIVQDSV